ncbi:MAG: carbohydrate binding family 9 domain-containing protein, partial [Rubrivivax sp.]|nr:carbohydrate binding family 9 domain-containing protein [Pyrinomonadaceae bacterium]
VRIPRFDKAPTIDGKMDEEIWKSGAVFKDFYQTSPGDNTAPTAPTEAFMGYDAKFLYVAFHCFDDPTKVRATVARRDNVSGEDNVRLYLDTFNDQRRAYVLMFNPFGIQQDGIFTEGQNIDFSVDIVMESKGTITSDGFIIEVAIPFKSLRYEAGKDKQWGVHVWRNIDRMNDEFDSWMPMARDASGTLNQAGRITGLEGISTERTIELIPSFTVSETGKSVRTMSRAFAGSLGLADQGKFVNEPIKVDPGLTAKFSISAAATLDLAINPDFAQVEADATVNTANQRFPIFFEEKRPFFLEGIEIFRTQIAAVHTRSIIDPDIAAKLTGKRGRNTYGLLVASDNAPGDFTNEQRYDPERLPVAGDRIIGKNATIGILRLKRDIGKENSIGFLATAYNFVNRSNYLGGFDSRWRLNKQTTFDFQVLGTTARRCSLAAAAEDDTCQTLNGFGYAYNFSQNKRHLWWNVNGSGRTAGYRADVGFTRRLNTNNHNLNIGYNTEPKPKATIVSWEMYSYLGGNFDWQKRMQNWNYEGSAGPNLQRQTFIRAGYNMGYERVFAYEFGVPTLADFRSEKSAPSKNVFAYIGSTPTKKINFFYFLGYRLGALDFDFGAGPRFPRVSPSAIARREAIADGLCTMQNEDDVLPVACLGLLDPGAGNLLYTNGNVTYKATNDLNMTLSFSKNRLARNDSGLVAFDSNIYSLRTVYQFTRFAFARARIDYSSITSSYRGQFLFGLTPSPGTALYVGYNDDMNRNFVNPFSGNQEPGFRRNARTFFIKASYLFRRSF